MAWPYQFIDLTKDEQHQRRVLLDRYGVYAQLSALVPIIGFQLYRLGVWVHSERARSRVDYAEVPSSPSLKKRRRSATGSLIHFCRSKRWWLGGEFAVVQGVRGRLIAAGIWTAWLLFLCVHRTGNDYMHITKRFGEIAASQFPFHYMLSMKSHFAPLTLVLHSSHEELMPYHQISGRIIWILLLQHGIWYINFFVQKGILLEKLTTSRAVILGVIGLLSINIIASSSLAAVRKWNYRLFFIIHLILGVALPPLFFFHASHMRIYMIEALALFVIDIIGRKLDTVTGFATITKVPRTKLVKLDVLLPEAKLARFRAAPGQHVYVNIPSESTPPHTSSPSIHDLLYNPFTVAKVSDKGITLVLRTLKGPTTKAFNALTTMTKAKPPINIEGPYGSTKKFPKLSSYDRILLVGGGVGATYVLPIYRDLKAQVESEGRNADSVRLVWSMRSTAEALWAADESEASLDGDENVQLYFTRTALDDHRDEIAPIDGSVELESVPLVDEDTVKLNGSHERPDLGGIVDEIFRYGVEERVAVLVCGPTKMAKELRRHVGKWAAKGREVFWHDEGFGL